ncbi:MAG: hypothetical protein ACXVCP_16540 [Bdellovibrio sp.]
MLLKKQGTKILSVFCLLGVISISNETNAATVSIPSCSYSDVSAAVSSASVGDILKVPAGTCTWNSTLTIDKGISLIGAGVGQTVIISNVPANSYQHTIDYQAADPSTNALFRVSGFTFDLGGGARSGISLFAGNTLVLQTKVRIDHNRFQNIMQDTTQYMFIELGKVRGVIDHNYFSNATYFARTNGDGNDWGQSLWDNWEGIVFGKVDNNMWFEDNTINVVNGGVIDCSQGMRYAFRYNTINADGGQPLFDQHGNYYSSYSCFGGELYGNNVVSTVGGNFLGQRGGRFFVFNNNFSTDQWGIGVREEYDDALTPVNNPSAYPQHVNGTYNWGNRGAFTGALIPTYKGSNCVGSVCYDTPMPVEGVDYFTDTSSIGITCGTLANRPSNCKAGQGYWATNQSCTDLTGMVGPNPATPISGTLYRCTAANTWDSGVSPLPYPHPLISESTLSSNPALQLKAPTNLRIL